MIAALPQKRILPQIALRPDQAKAIADIYGQWREVGNVLGVASTGFGKTMVAAKIALDFYNSPRKDGELWFCVHRISLVKSSIAAFVTMGVPVEEMTYYWADSTARINGVRSGNRKARIKIVMLPTLESWFKPGGSNQVFMPTEQIRLLILDEAHITSRSDIGMWMMQRSAKVLGLTATPCLDSPWESLGRDFDRVVLTTTHGELVQRGDLRPFVYERLASDKLFEGGALSEEGEKEELARLGKQLMKVEIQDHIIATTERYARKYAKDNNGVRKVAVFAPSQESAIVLAHRWGKKLGAGRVGYVLSDGCAIIGDTESDRLKSTTPTRSEIEDKFGEVGSSLDVLISYSAIAVGFDKPATSIVVLLRKISSLSMFVQSLGRACRRFPLCTYSLCLDFLGNLRSDSNLGGFAPVEELMWDADRILKQREKDGENESPTKLCPECDKQWHPNAKICDPDKDGCGYVFLSDEGGEADPVALEKLKMERMMTPFFVAKGGNDRLVEAVRLRWSQYLQGAMIQGSGRVTPEGCDPYPLMAEWVYGFAKSLAELNPDLVVPADILSHKYLGGSTKLFAPGWREDYCLLFCSKAIAREKGTKAYTSYWRLCALEFGAETVQRFYDETDSDRSVIVRKMMFRDWWVKGGGARGSAVKKFG